MAFTFLFIIIITLINACAFPGSSKPVIKIGLIAPFEGELRHHGYQRLYGVKLALQQANTKGGIAGYKIELVALNDYAEINESILQAHELALDSDVRGIVGQWEPGLYQANQTVYQPAMLGVINPSQNTDFTALPPNFAADFESLSGSAPSTEAQQAYLATQQLLQSIETAIQQTGAPHRKAVYLILNPAK